MEGQDSPSLVRQLGSCEHYQSGASLFQEAMHLARCLAFMSAKFEFELVPSHIKGLENLMANALSRDNLPMFSSLNPQAGSELIFQKLFSIW